MIKFLKKIVNGIFNGIINLGRKVLTLVFRIKRKGEETIEDFEKIQRGEEVDMTKYSGDENEKILNEFEKERHKIESSDPEVNPEEVEDMIETLRKEKIANIVEPEFEIFLDSVGDGKDYNVAAIEEFANRGLFHTKEVFIRHEDVELKEEEANAM